jgi:HPt (histidine-containing phosphotransfer) domain-containing protein
MVDLPGPSQDADAQLAEIRDSFRPRLTVRVAEISAEWEAVRPATAKLAGDAGNPAPTVSDLLRRLHRLAHSLAGTAGTFGFPAVGDAARRLERRLEQAGTALPPADASEIAILVDALSQAAALPLP